MITAQNEIQSVNGNLTASTTYFGLSTDSKPTTFIGNGSCFIEMDTGKVYFFNAAASAWVEWGANA